MNPVGSLLSLPLSWFSKLFGAAIVALAASPAAAQPDALWSASGEVDMRYRAQVGGSVLTRNTATIGQTIESDIIVSLEVGGTGGPSDDDPGSLSISNIGDDEAPRDLGDVDVNVGTLTLTDSVVSGRFGVGRPTSTMVMTLSATGLGTEIAVGGGGTFNAQASRIGVTVREGGIARVANSLGTVGSTLGADIEVDASTLLSADFRGAQVVTNCIVTGNLGTFREGVFAVESTSVDVAGDLTVGGNTTLAPPTDTDLILTSSVFESGTATVRNSTDRSTSLEMAGSTWRSFGLFLISNSDTQVDIRSGSQIDARADFRIASAFATIGSSTGASSRIDVAGDFDLDGSFASALTIEDGGYVDVDGTLTIGPFATLNLDGGTLRVGALDNSQGGVLNENGGTLVVPEAAGVAPPLAAALVLAWIRRAARRSVCGRSIPARRT